MFARHFFGRRMETVFAQLFTADTIRHGQFGFQVRRQFVMRRTGGRLDKKRAIVDDVWRYARVRVANVIYGRCKRDIVGFWRAGGKINRFCDFRPGASEGAPLTGAAEK